MAPSLPVAFLQTRRGEGDSREGWHYPSAASGSLSSGPGQTRPGQGRATVTHHHLHLQGPFLITLKMEFGHTSRDRSG
jgi:hypothetical protein